MLLWSQERANPYCWAGDGKLECSVAPWHISSPLWGCGCASAGRSEAWRRTSFTANSSGGHVPVCRTTVLRRQHSGHRAWKETLSRPHRQCCGSGEVLQLLLQPGGACKCMHQVLCKTSCVHLRGIVKIGVLHYTCTHIRSCYNITVLV